jgi:hypothetical protein
MPVIMFMIVDLPLPDGPTIGDRRAVSAANELEPRALLARVGD